MNLVGVGGWKNEMCDEATRNCHTELFRGGEKAFKMEQKWRQGRARGGYSPLSEHASPPSEGEKLFCRRFLAFTIP